MCLLPLAALRHDREQLGCVFPHMLLSIHMHVATFSRVHVIISSLDQCPPPLLVNHHPSGDELCEFTGPE
jgi:hypothetical protein